MLDALSKKFNKNRNTIRAYLAGLDSKGIRVTRPYTNGGGNTEPKSGYVLSNTGDHTEISAEVGERIRTESDLIRVLNIDTREWKIDRFTVSKSEATRKDRQVDWEVEDGVVVHGRVRDTGRLRIEPTFNVKVWLSRKTKEIRNVLVVDDIKADLKKFSHKYSKIKYPKLADGMLLEVEFPDLHLGKLSWGEESGQDSDLKIQTKRVHEALGQLMSYVKGFPIERILFPLGNDFWNSDDKFGNTTAGTKMSEDTRWKKTYRAGRVLAVEMIDRLSTIAPVDVLIITGNHSEQREFFLGDALWCWYRQNPNVTINNDAKTRKYYSFGKNLIGFVHGNTEKVSRLASLMAGEVPDLWSKSTYREWHLGHLHHKEETVQKTHEDGSVVIRVLRSLSPPDSWHYEHGFVGNVQAGEAFLWDREKGLVAQLTLTPGRD